MLYRAQVNFFDTGRLFYCSFFGSPSLSSQECVSNKTGGEVRVYSRPVVDFLITPLPTFLVLNPVRRFAKSPISDRSFCFVFEY